MAPRLKPLTVTAQGISTCAPCSRGFASSARRATLQRNAMFSWLNSPVHGGKFKEAPTDGPRYIQRDDEADDYGSSTRPFRLNPNFKSSPVLSDSLKDEIWKRVTKQKQTVRNVSSALGVSMPRVAAVIRLKTVEERWVKKGKPLATQYARALLGMLPQTSYSQGERNSPHEPINDLPVHPATLRQLFEPVPESRQYTRKDAGRAFDTTLLPPEKRIPHPNLVIRERERIQGLSPDTIRERQALRDKAEAEGTERRETARKQRLQIKEWTAPGAKKGGKGGRWQWRVTSMPADTILDSKKTAGSLGYRYGVPQTDRKKGDVKVPQRVE